MDIVDLKVSSVPKLSAKELRDILKRRNLPATGKKKELIKNVIDLVKPVEPLNITIKEPIVDTMPSTTNKDFMNFIKAEFSDFALDPINMKEDPCKSSFLKNNTIKLLDHQKTLQEFFRLHNHVGNKAAGSQGLFIYHSLGSGKSLSALQMAEVARVYSQDRLRKVIILIPASLRDDPWVKELSRIHPKYDSDALLTRIGYFILHYNNTTTFIDQLLNLSESKSTNPFDNSVVIVDEIHNFINTLPRSKETVRWQIYNWMIMAENAKFILLSGTPFSNTPFELAYLFNILRGQEIFEVRSESAQEDFMDMFFDDGKMINKQIFKRRIQGLVSYYMGADERVFAKKVIHKVLIPMSTLQQNHQNAIYKVEDNLRKGVKKGETGQSRTDVDSQIKTMQRGLALKKKHGFLAGSLAKALAIRSDVSEENTTQNFWVFSRSNSNITYPVEILDKYGRSTFDKVLDIDKFKKDKQSLSDIDFSKENLAILSPKMLKLLNIATRSKGLGLIYSNFEGAYGISALEEILKQNNYEKFNTNISKISELEPKQRFTVWSGTTSAEERRNILSIYNHPDNESGAYIKLICITAAGREGISLRGVRHVHIIEPWWNMSRIKQVIGRAVRICSHAHLPKEEQQVDIYNYFSVSSNKSTKGLELLDIQVSQSALKKQKQENDMLNEMKKASFDCDLNKAQTMIDNCINYQYSKTDKLFSKDIQEDLDNILDDDKLTEVVIDSKKYLIKGDQLYEFASKDKISSGFIPNKIGVAIFKNDKIVDIQKSLEDEFESYVISGRKVLVKSNNAYQFMNKDDLKRGLVPVKIGTVERENGNIVSLKK